MKYFDIEKELEYFRTAVFEKHPNLTNEVKDFEKEFELLIRPLSDYEKSETKSRALALREIIIKIRIDPNENNSVFLIDRLEEILRRIN